ncbi:MAG: DUF6498-containing protein [Candidatus Diapherotrites archaeon]|nr:DUF6498-containing protein [Candidatus Diapherotrites archaeon]
MCAVSVLPKVSLSDLIYDPSAILLLASNVLVIIMALFAGWGFADAFWVYVSQSAILSFFLVLKIARKRPTEEDLKNTEARFGKKEMERQKALLKEMEEKKWARPAMVFVIWLFLGVGLNIGLVYAIVRAGVDPAYLLTDFIALIPIILCFFISHLVSFVVYKKEMSYSEIDKAFLSNMRRFFIMYAFLGVTAYFIAATNQTSSKALLVVFLVGKTITDLWLHLGEHKSQRKYFSQKSSA